MKLDELEKELKEEDITYKGSCHDCGKQVEVKATVSEEGEITISGGAVYKIRQGPEELFFFKCDECFEKDHTLRNWKSCEVYSRVVGYLRPVKQYNIGKREEYKMRKEFTNTKGL